MVYASFCLFEALISAMLLASLDLQLFHIKLWTSYSFPVITHTLCNGKISLKGKKAGFQSFKTEKGSLDKIKWISQSPKIC